MLDRLANVLGGDAVGAGQVGDGAGDAQQAIVRARREAEPGHGQAEQPRRVGGQRAMAAGLAAGHAGVDVGGGAGEAGRLASAGGEDTDADDGGGLARGGVGELRVGQRGDFEVEIDAVEQRPGEAGQVAGALEGRAGAGLERSAAAAAGVGGGDELEAGGEAGGAGGAGDDDAGVLERRRASSTRWENSGSSSRKSTP